MKNVLTADLFVAPFAAAVNVLRFAAATSDEQQTMNKRKEFTEMSEKLFERIEKKIKSYRDQRSELAIAYETKLWENENRIKELKSIDADVLENVSLILESKTEIEKLSKENEILNKYLEDLNRFGLSNQKESEEILEELREFVENKEESLIEYAKPIIRDLEEKLKDVDDECRMARDLLDSWYQNCYPFGFSIGNNNYIDYRMSPFRAQLTPKSKIHFEIGQFTKRSETALKEMEDNE